MKILRINQNLPFIDVIVVFSDANELQLQPIGLMNYWRSVSKLHVVKGVNTPMRSHPRLLPGEKLQGCRPRLQLDVLLCVFAKILKDLAVNWANIIAVK
jgi:hypothetical protein